MPTISELEQSLTDAANAGDMGGITSIVSSLTTEEKAAFDPTVFGYALTAVANYTMTDPALAASTAGTFMQDVGLYTDSGSISQSFSIFGQFGNFAGVTSMVDNTDPSIYPSLDSMALGNALSGISFDLFSDPANVVATTADFLSHLSLYTPPSAITMVMQNFAGFGLINGVTAVVDNIDPQIYSHLDPIMLGQTLAGVAMNPFNDPSAASAVADFLSHLGPYTDPQLISFAFLNAAQSASFGGGLDVFNAILNNIDPQIYSSLNSFILGQALDQAAGAAFYDPAGAAATAGNFVSHLGLYTDPGSISHTLLTFVEVANFGGQAAGLDGVNAIVNNLDPQVYASLDSRILGEAFSELPGVAFYDPTDAVATMGNFLSHLGLYTDPEFITGTLVMLSQAGFFGPTSLLAGMNAIIDNLDPQVYASLDSRELGFALGNLTASLFYDHDGTISTLANFVSHLGLYTDPQSISATLSQLGSFGWQQGAYDAIITIVDNLDPQVYPALDSSQLGITLLDLAFSSYLDPAKAVTMVTDFLSHLSLYTDTNDIAFSMTTFAQAGALAGANAVIETIDPQVYSHFDATNLGYAMYNIANQTSLLDGHDVAATLGLFSEKLLPYADETWVEQSLQTVTSAGNLSAFGAVLDYTTSAQWDGLSAGFKSGLAGLGITVGTYLDDKYAGTSGTDKYFGLGGNDNVDGKASDDILFGNAGDDKLTGGDGNDILAGGIGVDLLTGGAGSDTFVLGFGGVDKVADFNKATGGDKLDFRDIISNYDSSHPITDYVHAHTSGTNTFISFDADGAGPGAAVDIAKLQGVTGIDIQSLFDHGQILI